MPPLGTSINNYQPTYYTPPPTILPKNGQNSAKILPKNGQKPVNLLPKNGHAYSYANDLQEDRAQDRDVAKNGHGKVKFNTKFSKNFYLFHSAQNNLAVV